MENVFSEQISGIYRLRVPFENIYTSVFLIESDGKKILVDCGTTSVDVDTVIGRENVEECLVKCKECIGDKK